MFLLCEQHASLKPIVNFPKNVFTVNSRFSITHINIFQHSSLYLHRMCPTRLGLDQQAKCKGLWEQKSQAVSC